MQFNKLAVYNFVDQCMHILYKVWSSPSCGNGSLEIFENKSLIIFIITKPLQSSIVQPNLDILSHNSLSRDQTPIQN